MLWRKKRRLPLTGLSLMYIICGCALVIGNVYIMHSGFVQLFDDPRNDDEERVRVVLARRRLIETLQDIPSLAIPESLQTKHLSISPQLKFNEPNLRRLMDSNIHKTSSVGDTNSANKDMDVENINVLRSSLSPHIDERNKKESDLLAVSDSQLRAVLNKTSNCVKLQSLTNRDFVASGWTKAVYKTSLGERPVALKTIDLSGHDMTKCGQQLEESLSFCYKKASQKILKELLLLRSLNIPHVIKVLDYCVPIHDYDGTPSTEISVAVELGETIDIIKLLQMSWEERLKISLGVTQLLASLAQSPFGAVALNDFRRQQFVLVGGDIKLTDVDDMSFEEPICDTSADCEHFFSSANFTLKSTCKSGRCNGYNERKNIFNAARHFTTFLLPHGAPASLRQDVDLIVSAFSNVTITSRQLLMQLNSVIDNYKTGQYLHRDKSSSATKYKSYPASDLAGLFDYRCRYSVASGMCTVSVFDQREAEQLCDNDPDCRAFVLSKHRTWTGRIIAHLKNNFTQPTTNSDTHLFVKPALRANT